MRQRGHWQTRGNDQTIAAMIYQPQLPSRYHRYQICIVSMIGYDGLVITFPSRGRLYGVGKLRIHKEPASEHENTAHISSPEGYRDFAVIARTHVTFTLE